MAARRWGWVLLAVAAAGAATVGGLALRRAADAREAHALAASLSLPAAAEHFDPATLADLPEPARRYLTAAIAPGTPLARSVRLTMTGRFRIGQDWLPLRADQWIAADGFLWDARLTRDGTGIRVWDRMGPRGGATRVWLMGLVPLARADGPDVYRSAAGRLAAEVALWLPAALLPGAGNPVRWEAGEADTAEAHTVVAGVPIQVTLRLDAQGHPRAVWLDRWGDPDGDGTFTRVRFGGNLADSRTFGGYTIPTRITAGWGFGGADYLPFFDVTVTGADFSGRP